MLIGPLLKVLKMRVAELEAELSKYQPKQQASMKTEIISAPVEEARPSSEGCMAKWSDERKLVSFRKADTSGDGLVDVEELVNLVEKENIGLSRPEARRLFTQFDLDGNGALDECEWLAAMRKSSLFKA